MYHTRLQAATFHRRTRLHIAGAGHIASESQLNWNDRVAPTGTSADVKVIASVDLPARYQFV